MSKIEQIEQAVSALSIDELRQFADWFAAFQADLWDRRIEQDAKDGRLDATAQDALSQYRAGRTTPL